MSHEQVNLETFLEDLSRPPAAPSEPGAPAPEPTYFEHPLVKPGVVEARPYQTSLARKALAGRVLVVLPTGLGKTIIALMAAASVLHEDKGKVVFLAPTRPLVQQHAKTFGELLEVDGQAMVGGSISPAKRAALFDEGRVVFSTPQGIRNDLVEGRISLDAVGLLIVDEAHRAVGDYAYVEIAQRYLDARPDGLLLGLTASPGGDKDRVEDVLENLGVRSIESRDVSSPDVRPYVKDISVRWVKVPLTTPMVRLKARLDRVVNERATALRRARVLPGKPFVSRKDVIEANAKLRAQLNRPGVNKGAVFGMILNAGVVMQALHALELLETQGIEPLRDYLERMMREPKNKSAKTFISDPRVVEVLHHAQQWEGPSHPKIEALVRVLETELARGEDALVIVFAQYRDTIASIVRALGREGIDAEKFVGQADREGDHGMSQDEQRTALDRLRASEFQVLVASSVAEEGLDIPRVDLVVFYEPVPSEIRLIQRRGRTGRHSIGRVAVLIAEDTRDEAFMYAATSREKKMKRLVREMG